MSAKAQQGISPEIEQFVGLAAAPGQRASSLVSAFGNSVYSSAQTLNAPGAAPSSYNFQTLLLTAKRTGIFMVGWGFPFNSGTSGDVITLSLVAQGWQSVSWSSIASTGHITLTHASVQGQVGSIAGGAVNGGSAPGAYTASAGGTAITATFTGVGTTSSVAATYADPVVAGATTTQGMDWWSDTAIVTTGGSPAAFAIGSPVAFMFEISATNTVTMTGNATFWAWEIPIL